MLPEVLYGPSLGPEDDESHAFLKAAFAAYPKLNQDFIKQACCEHPERTNHYFPNFNPDEHVVIEREVSPNWINENVRYDHSLELDDERFYGFHFKNYPNERPHFHVYNFMIQHYTWPFPPIFVQRDFAREELGSHDWLGTPFHLFEGCHRISYLLKMLQMKLIDGESRHTVLEIRCGL